MNIYPADFENKIGFDSVRKHLSDFCSTRLGSEEVNKMSFSTNRELIVHQLSCINEMMSIINGGISYITPSSHDVVSYLHEISAENSYLSAERLYKILQILVSFNEVRTFYCVSKSDEVGVEKYSYPAIALELKQLTSFPSLINEIANVVNKFGEIKDTASPELYDIRQKIKRSAGSMQKMMSSVLERAMKSGIVDNDVTPVIRDGRLVIPVNAGKKRELVGIVHDESATGKTVFIEPAEVVEAGNKIRELEIEEKREETRILIAVAAKIRPYIDDICSGCQLLGSLDFIIAKAKYAIEVGAQLPIISKHQELEWYHAIHPTLLLSLKAINKETIPLYLTLDKAHRILIISGPNAGGKSVTIKTVAIVQYMFQCGMMPTLHSNSHMGIFNRIMIDIGDEQSIENELSTYSSHLRNMKYFLNFANQRTLFLADEMGSGTEPQIGGAIAQAILTELGKSGAFGIVTTHYQNIKNFAENTEGFINGAMMYDRQHLQPLFKLEIGTPGSSFALDIAYKMGLPLNVIEDAKDIVGNEYVNIDKYLSDIQRDRRYWNNKRLNIREKEAKLDSILEKYESQAGNIKQQRKEIIDEARREAKELVEGLNSKIERTILEIRKINAEKERTKVLRSELKEFVDETLNPSVQDSKLSLSKISSDLKYPKRRRKKSGETDSKKEIEDRSDVKVKFAVGDYVKLEQSNISGQILSIDGNKAEVAFGGLRTIVALDKLVKGKKSKPSALNDVPGIGNSTSESSRERQLNFKREIDVRGMRADEALQAVTYFIDDAIQFQADKVRILHGTGHGILRTLIREQLKSNSAVKHFEDEDIRFGGAGITVVEFE